MLNVIYIHDGYVFGFGLKGDAMATSIRGDVGVYYGWGEGGINYSNTVFAVYYMGGAR